MWKSKSVALSLSLQQLKSKALATLRLKAARKRLKKFKFQLTAEGLKMGQTTEGSTRGGRKRGAATKERSTR